VLNGTPGTFTGCWTTGFTSERCKAYQSSNIKEQDVSEAFQNVETFWEDLFPVERNRLIRLLDDKVEIRLFNSAIGLSLAQKSGVSNALCSDSKKIDNRGFCALISLFENVRFYFFHPSGAFSKNRQYRLE
jgi:hypothetical protein